MASSLCQASRPFCVTSPAFRFLQFICTPVKNHAAGVKLQNACLSRFSPRHASSAVAVEIRENHPSHIGLGAHSAGGGNLVPGCIMYSVCAKYICMLHADKMVTMRSTWSLRYV